jgi:hypothetical protein
VPGLRLDSDRVQALLPALAIFRLHPNGFTNAELKTHLAPLHGLAPDQITPGRMSHELRRLRLHGLIERIPAASATASPTRACARPSCSPAPTPGSSAPPSPNWPTRPHQPPADYARRSTGRSKPSTTSPATPT